jgi:hypothetical protein
MVKYNADQERIKKLRSLVSVETEGVDVVQVVSAVDSVGIALRQAEASGQVISLVD